jgi:hypothetical protein
MAAEPPRSRAARHAAEQALVRVVHHYGSTPEFVLIGGLVPELLCSTSGMVHAGTTDVDVQVDLEIAAGAVNMARLEQALASAEFEVDPQRVWRWQTEADGRRAVVKFRTEPVPGDGDGRIGASEVVVEQHEGDVVPVLRPSPPRCWRTTQVPMTPNSVPTPSSSSGRSMPASSAGTDPPHPLPPRARRLASYRLEPAGWPVTASSPPVGQVKGLTGSQGGRGRL